MLPGGKFAAELPPPLPVLAELFAALLAGVVVLALAGRSLAINDGEADASGVGLGEDVAAISVCGAAGFDEQAVCASETVTLNNARKNNLLVCGFIKHSL